MHAHKIDVEQKSILVGRITTMLTFLNCSLDVELRSEHWIMVLRIRPTPIWAEANILYTPLGNTFACFTSAKVEWCSDAPLCSTVTV